MRLNFKIFVSAITITSFLLYSCQNNSSNPSVAEIKKSFVSPPDSVRPGVYWYFMDGNMNKEAITKDLESMKKAGISNVLFLEVNVGVPKGKVDLLSEEWQDSFVFMMNECKRLGITMTLGVGPGWTGSGGPWVPGKESMRHLVGNSKNVTGPSMQTIEITIPQPRTPFFGEGTLTPELRSQWNDYYEDVFVLAYPTQTQEIADIDEKAIYYRAPFSSMPGVKPFLPEPYLNANENLNGIEIDKIIDLTPNLQKDGTIKWQVPEGNWTITRFGMRNNGAITRPAPFPALGFECDKFDTLAFKNHFDTFILKLLNKANFSKASKTGGLNRLHMDSWEMGAQNWTNNFREEFKQRRGYDPLPYIPTYIGKIVGTKELSERFLWDVRLTSQELVLENHAEYIKKLGRRYGFDFSIEPYDMNPCTDLDLGAVADVPSCEFWLKGKGFNTAYSCVEAVSIAHVMGYPTVSAESFTGEPSEGFTGYPGSMKNQSDWAFAMGINRFIFHTYAHKSLNDSLKPGMTMGPYGVHWDSGQTWWPMVDAYHEYLSRCSFVLQQGTTVADILYLTPEGAPHVFLPPKTALEGNDTIPDRRGYNFDGCSPLMLLKASVKNHKIVFPGGASYNLLVLPAQKTMTPETLKKIEQLIKDGARVIGGPYEKSPSLANYPTCDNEVSNLSQKIWGTLTMPASLTIHKYGKGDIYWGGDLINSDDKELFVSYEKTANILKELGVLEDFKANGKIRYTHKKLPGMDIYFVSNRTEDSFITDCDFNVNSGSIELWDPLTGKISELGQFSNINNRTVVPIKFDSYQSYFVVFYKDVQKKKSVSSNFKETKTILNVNGSWNVSFDPKWGGPSQIVFNDLTDWTVSEEEGIRFYSGIATYKKIFSFEYPTIKKIFTCI